MASRTINVSPTPLAHSALDDLDADDHDQYALTDGSRGDFATEAQGALADSATQPGDLSTVATTGVYADLTSKPTLGTAAAADSTAFDAAGAASTAQAAAVQRANHTGSQAISTVTGLQTDLDAKALATRTITAGTGLTGGGDLSANRTLSPDFGTGSGKVAQGNDSRFNTMTTRTVATTSDTPTVADAAGQILFSSGSPIAVTMPASVFSAGMSVVLRPTGAGQITVSAGAGATMRSPNGTKSAGQYRALVITYVSGSEFVVDGDAAT